MHVTIWLCVISISHIICSWRTQTYKICTSILDNQPPIQVSTTAILYIHSILHNMAPTQYTVHLNIHRIWRNKIYTNSMFAHLRPYCVPICYQAYEFNGNIKLHRISHVGTLQRLIIELVSFCYNQNLLCSRVNNSYVYVQSH